MNVVTSMVDDLGAFCMDLETLALGPQAPQTGTDTLSPRTEPLSQACRVPTNVCAASTELQYTRAHLVVNGARG